MPKFHLYRAIAPVIESLEQRSLMAGHISAYGNTSLDVTGDWDGTGYPPPAVTGTKSFTVTAHGWTPASPSSPASNPDIAFEVGTGGMTYWKFTAGIGSQMSAKIFGGGQQAEEQEPDDSFDMTYDGTVWHDSNDTSTVVPATYWYEPPSWMGLDRSIGDFWSKSVNAVVPIEDGSATFGFEYGQDPFILQVGVGFGGYGGLVCAPCDASTTNPVRYSDGAANLTFSDFLPTNGSMLPLQRGWSNKSYSADAQVASFGNGTSLDGIPYLQNLNGQMVRGGIDKMGTGFPMGFGVIESSTAGYAVFQKSATSYTNTADGYRNKIGFHNGANTIVQVDADGTVTTYANFLVSNGTNGGWLPNQVGQMRSRVKPNGDRLEVIWDDTNDRPAGYRSITRAAKGTDYVVDKIAFEPSVDGSYVSRAVQYRGTAESSDEEDVDAATLTATRTVDYEYYDYADYYDEEHVPNGDYGDLKYVRIHSGGPSTPIISTNYYRWYAAESYGLGDGVRLLKSFVGNEAYQKAIKNIPDGEDGLEDASLESDGTGDLAPYVDNFFTYDSEHRVLSETATEAGAGCSCGKTGAGTYVFDYHDNTGRSASGNNSWRTRTTVTMPDGNENIVYTNDSGNVILKVIYDTANSTSYSTWYQYDDHGNVIKQAQGNAISAYNSTTRDDFEAFPDLIGYGVTTGSNVSKLELSGRVDVTNYFTAADNIADDISDRNRLNYVKSAGVQQGADDSTLKLTHSYEYVDDGQSDGLYFVSKETAYPIAPVVGSLVASGARVTTYSYTWGETSQPTSTTTHLAAIDSSQHGADSIGGSSSDDNYVETSIFDSAGRTIWHIDGKGYINYYEYDLQTGAKTKEIDDVDPSIVSGPPVTAPERDDALPDALNLTTTILNDERGRKIEMIDPNDNATFWFYDDGSENGTASGNKPSQVFTYSGMHVNRNGSDPITYDPPVNPVSVTIDDPSTGIKDTLTYTWTGGVPVNSLGAPTNAEKGFADSSNPAIQNANFQIQSLVRNVRNVSDQNIETWNYISFDGLAYLPKQGGWATLGTAGTHYLLTKYKYDTGGRLFHTELPSGDVTDKVFDARGLVLSEWQGTDDLPTTGDWSPANTLGTNMVMVAAFTYDDSGNQLTQVQYDGTSSHTTISQYDFRDRLTYVRDPDDIAVKYTYDNLGEVTEADTFADTSNYRVIDAGESMSQADTNYDDQGRVYQSSVTNSTGSQVTNLWYDLNGSLIKSATEGQVTQKMSYDGAGRVTTTFLSDASGDSSYTDALNVTGDRVLEQTENVYDATGNVILTRYRQRFHDDTTTGELGDPTTTTQTKARVYYQTHYYDAAGRLTDDVDVGTNGGAAYTRLGSAPSRSDTVHVATYLPDDAGRPYRMTDANGKETRTYYDLAGRVKKTVANYQDGTVSAADDQTVSYTYNGNGQILTQTAALAGGSSQITEYVYGVSSADGSDIASNSLIRMVKYPDPTTGAASSASSGQESYTYDALGRVKTKTDRNGTIHQYSYDNVGRQISDKLTALGTGVDGSVQRIDTAYDEFGNPYLLTSYAGTTTSTVVNQIWREYNSSHQITREYQAVDGAVSLSGSITPSVQYTYDLPSKNSRLTSVTYPNARLITYSYGATNSVDDHISRLTSINDGAPSLLQYLETETYLGLSTIIARSHAQNQLVQQLYYDGSTTGDAGDQYVGMDRFGRVADLESYIAPLSGGAIVDHVKYAYDKNGNRLYAENIAYSGYSYFSTYDGLNRLSSSERGTLNSTKTGILGPVKRTQSWSLDAVGNSSSVTTNGTSGSRVNNKQNEALVIATNRFIYDNNGNQLANGAAADFDHNGRVNTADRTILLAHNGMTNAQWSDGDADGNGIVNAADNTIYNSQTGTFAYYNFYKYTYDGWNRLVGISKTYAGTTTSVAYAYDALGRRVKDGSTRVYFNNNWQDIEERNSSTSVSAQYTWSPIYIDAMIERDRDTNSDGDVLDSTDERLYPTQDANWNVTSLVDKNGVVQERFIYDAYGSQQVLSPSWATATDSFNWRQGFQGGMYDTFLSSQILFRNRTYDTATMRWMQQDPLGVAYQDGMNLYEFVQSDPVTNTDPMGLQSQAQPTTKPAPRYKNNPGGYTNPSITDNFDLWIDRGPNELNGYFENRFRNSLANYKNIYTRRINDVLAGSKCRTGSYELAKGLVNAVPNGPNGKPLNWWQDLQRGTVQPGDKPFADDEYAYIIGRTHWDVGPIQVNAKKVGCCSGGDLLEISWSASLLVHDQRGSSRIGLTNNGVRASFPLSGSFRICCGGASGDGGGVETT